MKRKILSALLALCMMVSLFPTAAFAADPDSTAPVAGTSADDPAKETPPADDTTAPSEDGTTPADGTTTPGEDEETSTEPTEKPETPETPAVSTATVKSQSELKAALADENITSITLANDIAFKEAWNTVEIKKDRTLVIDGASHTISNMTVHDYLLKATDPGQTGNDCDYYTGFIGSNHGDLTIKNLTFDKATVQMDPLSPKNDEVENSKGSKGSSIIAVVCGENRGTALLENVTVSNSTVKGSTKVGLLNGFTQKNTDGAETPELVAEHCAITDSTVCLIADGWDKEAAFAGVIFGYNPHGYASTNGIKLKNNTCTVDESVDWKAAVQTAKDGTKYVTSGNTDWGLISPTYSTDGQGMNAFVYEASVDGYAYETLEEALSAAKADDTIDLLADVVIAEKVTLDLDGRKILTNSHTINVTAGGATTITGNGTIENTKETTKTGAPFGLIVVAEGASLVIENGTFLSKGFQLITVNGTATIVDGEFLCTAADTGAYDGKTAITIGGTKAKLTMIGGTVDTGKSSADHVNDGMYGIYVSNGGTVVLGDKETHTGPSVTSYFAALGANNYTATADFTVYGGTYTSSFANTKTYAKFCAAMYLSCDGTVNIEGGTFNGKGAYALSIPYKNTATTVNIKGGEFNDQAGLFYIGEGTGDYPENVTDTQTEISVTGGYFTSDPSEYLAEGKLAVASDQAGYTYMVGAKPDIATNVDVKPADPVVDTTVVPDAQKETVTNAVKGAEAPDLKAAANSVITEVKAEDATAAVAQLQAALGGGAIEASSVTLVAQPYMDIKVTEYNETAGEKVLTLDITPMCQLVATTNPDDIKLDTDKNAVKVGKAEEMKVETPVTITVPVPGALFTEDTNLYVKHTKGNGTVYYYKATISGEDSAKVITFTTEHGFSPFAISEDARNAKVKFTKLDESTVDVTYTPADVASAFPVDTKSGYEFDGWKFEGVEGATGTYKTLTDSLLTALSKAYSKQTADPKPALVATPVFSSNSWDFGGGGSTGATYIITASAGEGGTISPSGKVSVSSGSDKTFTIAASTGYTIADVKVDGTSVGAVKSYTFEDVKKAHTIEASFKTLDAEGTFTDVKADDWFYDAVQYAYSHELMNGVGNGKFEPNATTTRGMIVTILYRLEKEPAAQAAQFADVAADAYYANAVAWAAEKGIVKGYSDTQFGANDAITREQMASILYRYAQLKGYSVSGKTELTGFTDASSISDYAVEAMQWANGEKLIQGVTTSTIQPQGSATRAQVATILMRFIENVAK